LGDVFTCVYIGGALAVARIAQAQPTAPPTPVATPTAQQMFDAGENAIAAGRYAQAVMTFTALETRLAANGKPNSRSLAVARLRLGQSEFRLNAFDAVIGHLLPALEGLTAPADAALRVEALDFLGRAEEETFAPSAAAGHLRAALGLVPPDQAAYRAALGVMIARNELFDDPARVAAELASAKPEMVRALAANKVALSEYWLIYGRALLIQHALRPARAAFEKAIELTGGLTTRVSYYAQSARADAALAAELSNDMEGAARLTAYTGAGTMAKSSLKLPADADPPPCGGIAELKSDDYAVVQFSIDNDGAVIGAQPVFASRSGPMAYAFARAVAGWSWTREEAAAIEPFFRSATRVEIRCTTRGDRQTAVDLLKPDYAAWATEATRHQVSRWKRRRRRRRLLYCGRAWWIPRPGLVRPPPSWFLSLSRWHVIHRSIRSSSVIMRAGRFKSRYKRMRRPRFERGLGWCC